MAGAVYGATQAEHALLAHVRPGLTGQLLTGTLQVRQYDQTCCRVTDVSEYSVPTCVSQIKASVPVRVGDVIGGHVHPSLCVTHSGAVLAVYNEDGGGAAVLKICRSEDGGQTWSGPAPIPASACRSRRGVYPGSLSVLRSGRIVLQWAPYYERGEHQHGDSDQFALAPDIGAGEVYRVPEYCVSDDDGHTFGPTVYQIGPHHNLTNYSELRFPLVEQDDGTWILPFYDRTVAYDPEARIVVPFGNCDSHGAFAQCCDQHSQEKTRPARRELANRIDSDVARTGQETAATTAWYQLSRPRVVHWSVAPHRRTRRSPWASRTPQAAW